MIIAITGLTGILGHFLAQEFAGKAHITVRGLKRSSSQIDTIPGKIDWIEGNLLDKKSMKTFVKDADYVIHCAFDHIHERYRKGEGDDLLPFLEKNLLGTLSLMELSYQAGVRRFINVSSRAAYGAWPSDTRLDENMFCKPDTHYGALKLSTDAFAQSYARQNNWQICSIRPTGIYGIYDRVENAKWFNTIYQTLRGYPLVTNNGGTEVHGKDLAKMVHALLESEQDISGQIFNCSDLYITEKDVVEFVCAHENLVVIPPKSLHIRKPSMDCSLIKTMGVKFGGKPLWEETLIDMIHAIKPMIQN